MPYPEGRLIWGIPFILVACAVEFGVRRYMNNHTDEPTGWKKEKRIKMITRGITLAVLTLGYIIVTR